MGVVEVRVVGASVVDRVPVTDGNGRPDESRQNALVIWVEVRTDATSRTVTVRRWQGLDDDSTLVGKGGVAISPAQLGLMSSLRTGLPWPQTVVPGGKPRVNVLVYKAPGSEVGDPVLILDAGRVGEVGKFSFVIPRTAFAP